MKYPGAHLLLRCRFKSWPSSPRCWTHAPVRARVQGTKAPRACPSVRLRPARAEIDPQAMCPLEGCMRLACARRPYSLAVALKGHFIRVSLRPSLSPCPASGSPVGINPLRTSVFPLSTPLPSPLCLAIGDSDVRDAKTREGDGRESGERESARGGAANAVLRSLRTSGDKPDATALDVAGREHYGLVPRPVVGCCCRDGLELYLLDFC